MSTTFKTFTTFPGVSTPVTGGDDASWSPSVPLGHTAYTWKGDSPNATPNTDSAVLDVFITAKDTAAEDVKSSA